MHITPQSFDLMINGRISELEVTKKEYHSRLIRLQLSKALASRDRIHYLKGHIDALKLLAEDAQSTINNKRREINGWGEAKVDYLADYLPTAF